MTDTEAIELARLQRAFERLPRLQAVVFFSVHHDRLSYAEIGKRAGRPARQIKFILADALCRLLDDVREQKQGVMVGPIRRFLREWHLNLRLWFRLWRNRW